MTYTCSHCGIVFDRRGGYPRKYCSSKCYQAAKISKLGRKLTKAEINAAYRKRNTEKHLKQAREYYYRTRRQQKNKRLMGRYGVSIEWYEAQLLKQENKCAGCNQPEKATNSRTGVLFGLAVDHDHETGKVRGLLCAHCNAILGAIEAHRDTVAQLLTYLKLYGKDDLFDERSPSLAREPIPVRLHRSNWHGKARQRAIRNIP